MLCYTKLEMDIFEIILQYMKFNCTNAVGMLRKIIKAPFESWNKFRAISPFTNNTSLGRVSEVRACYPISMSSFPMVRIRTRRTREVSSAPRGGLFAKFYEEKFVNIFVAKFSVNLDVIFFIYYFYILPRIKIF